MPRRKKVVTEEIELTESNNKINDTSNYNADSIKVLSDIQHIKLRKGMYIGEADNPRALINEMMDNAIDEVQAGFSDELIVSVDTKNNRYTVRDHGRGIPIAMKKLDDGTEMETLEVICTKSNSGGKFDNSNYTHSVGLNGLGLTVTNALSSEFRIMTIRDGKSVELISDHGEKVALNYLDTSEVNGTKVTFIPDNEIFNSSVIPVLYIQNRCKIMSAFGYRARLIVDDEEVDTNASIYDLMYEDTEEKISDYWSLPEVNVTTENGEEMKIALKYTSSTSDKYYGYTNLLYNSLGGTHVNEAYKAVIAAWNEFLDSHKKLRPAVDLRNSDFLLGGRLLCAVFIMKPEFSSQTKEKLVVDKKYLKDLMDKFKSEFIKVLEDNIVLAQSLIMRFEEYRISQNKLLARKEISSLIKVNTDSSDNIRRRSIVSKLVECTSKKREGTELFICEGDSAKGPYLAVRNREKQAVLPLRGKILNVTYKDVKDAVKNNEICDIANAIGTGIGSNCDASKSRYERVIISGDADPDGLQINCLVLSVFINMFPDMVRQGRVFISMPPLYCWNTKSGYGWTNDVNKVPSNTKVVRFKGLGEMQNEELKYFLVDENTRNLIQVEYPTDIDKFNSILGSSRGKHDLMVELGIIEESC